MEKEYKIDNKIQLGKALKYLDTLGYVWNSGRGLTEWRPDTTADDFPIVLNTGISDRPNAVTYGQLGWNDYKPPFDNLLDAPDYSGGSVGEDNLEEIDTEEGQTANEIFSEFLGELSELLGLTEDEELEFDDEPEAEGIDDQYKYSEPPEEKANKYTVRLTNGESVYITRYKGVYNSDFIIGRGDTDKLTAKQLFMYLTDERVEPDSTTTGKADIRQGIDNIKAIEVDGTHKEGEFESDVRFTVIADGKHVTIDRYSYIGNDYHLFEYPAIYDGNKLTFDELLAFITGEGDVGYCDSFEEMQSITIVTPDEEDEEDEETLDDTPDESGETKFVIHLTNGSVMWRIPRNAYSDFLGSASRFDKAGVGFYHEVEEWYYKLDVDELTEALRLIDLSDLANISTVK